jgi:hypothetical protein
MSDLLTSRPGIFHPNSRATGISRSPVWTSVLAVLFANHAVFSWVFLARFRYPFVPESRIEALSGLGMQIAYKLSMQRSDGNCFSDSCNSN